MKKLLFVHGGEIWGSYDDYLQFLKAEPYDPFVEKNTAIKWNRRWTENLPEYRTVRLEMPCKLNARYPEWKLVFESVKDAIDENTVLVGHSLGSNFLAKYLSENDLNNIVPQLHLVAGCFGAPGGFELKEDLTKIKTQAQKVWIYHSTDDAIVPFCEAEAYHDKITNATLAKFKDRGHFNDETFPELIQNIRGIIA